MNRIETNLPGVGAPGRTTADEAARLAALHDLRVLDTEPDPRFERIVRLAARLFAAPRAGIVLIDERRAWLKAAVGIDRDELARAPGALADAALRLGEAIFVGDIRQDERLNGADGEGGEVRFYAAAPLSPPTARSSACSAWPTPSRMPNPAKPSAPP